MVYGLYYKTLFQSWKPKAAHPGISVVIVRAAGPKQSQEGKGDCFASVAMTLGRTEIPEAGNPESSSVGYAILYRAAREPVSGLFRERLHSSVRT